MASAQPLRTALAALLLAASTWSAQALQLGDTKAHILARHGTPSVEDTTNKLATYSWDGWTAQLTFQEGLVEKLTYRKNIPLQESEIFSLLQSNGGRNRWREATPSDGVRRWERDDGAVAEFVSGEATNMVFSRTRSPETTPIPAITSTPAPTPTPAAILAQAVVPAIKPIQVPATQTPAASASPAPVPAAPATATPAVAAAPKMAPAQSPAPEPKQTPIVTSGLSLAPIFAMPVLSVEQPPLRAAPKIEERPTQVGNDPDFQTSPRPRRLEAVEQPAPEVTTTTEAETAKPVELKPIASREPRFRVSPSPAATPAVPISAPAKVPRRATPSGFWVIAAFVVLTGVITGLVLILRKRLVGKPHRLSLNSNPQASISASQTTVRAAPTIPGLDTLRWDQFELIVAETYRREDFIVEISAGLDAEGGIDLTLRRESETFLVQCSHWKAASIAEREVREFYGMMAATGAPQGIIATLGTFTRDAQTFAAEKGIELLDRAALEKRIAETARPDEDFCAVGDWIDDFTAHARIFDPECPVCNRSMVIRQSRVGGAAVWGCRSYPRCPGKREPRMDLITVAAGR